MIKFQSIWPVPRDSNWMETYDVAKSLEAITLLRLASNLSSWLDQIPPNSLPWSVQQAIITTSRQRTPRCKRVHSKQVRVRKKGSSPANSKDNSNKLSCHSLLRISGTQKSLLRSSKPRKWRGHLIFSSNWRDLCLTLKDSRFKGFHLHKSRFSTKARNSTGPTLKVYLTADVLSIRPSQTVGHLLKRDLNKYHFSRIKEERSHTKILALGNTELWTESNKPCSYSLRRTTHTQVAAKLADRPGLQSAQSAPCPLKTASTTKTKWLTWSSEWLPSRKL